MKNAIPRMMVLFMTTAFAYANQNIDWSNFNSSLVIEVTRPEGKFTCSGVAIKDDLVLTAAHCLEGEILNVKVFTQESYDPESKSIGALHFQLHPDYNRSKSNFRSDLAKIKLAEKLPSSTVIYPILKSANNFNGKLLRLGFGARSFSNVRTLITPEFRALQREIEVLELNDMYSYSGDSGGPIFIQHGGQMYLAAIHSTLSTGPQGKFSYNPLVSGQQDWIFAAWN